MAASKSPGLPPLSPERRVVDAGYYDNFGVDLAAMWLFRNEAVVREHTSGGAVIEVRAYRNGYARWHFQDKEAEKYRPDPTRPGPQVPRRDRGALRASLEWLSTPAEAIGNARGGPRITATTSCWTCSTSASTAPTGRTSSRPWRSSASSMRH